MNEQTKAFTSNKKRDVITHELFTCTGKHRRNDPGRCNGRTKGTALFG